MTTQPDAWRPDDEGSGQTGATYLLMATPGADTPTVISMADVEPDPCVICDAAIAAAPGYEDDPGWPERMRRLLDVAQRARGLPHTHQVAEILAQTRQQLAEEEAWTAGRTCDGCRAPLTSFFPSRNVGMCETEDCYAETPLGPGAPRSWTKWTDWQGGEGEDAS